MFNPFRKTYSDSEMEVINFLRSVKVFQSLNNKQISQFIPYMYLRDYQLDEVIFFRNDPSNALYIVKSGVISLSLDIDDTMEKLKDATPGTAFGDNVFIEDTKRIYNAIVVSDSAAL